MAHKNNKNHKITTTIKKISALMAAAVLATSIPADMLGSEMPAVVKAANAINGHEYLTENSNYRLYVSEEDLSVIIEDKSTGAIMESAISKDDGKNNDTWVGAMKSAVVATLIQGSDDTKQADLINDNVTKDIKYTDNGFSAQLYWQKYKLGLTLNVSLTEEGFVACIPEESIREDSDGYYFGTISMYPYMGVSYMDEKEGYIFIPDGNGALIYLNDKEGRFKSGYSSMIYGKDIGFEESNVETLLWNKYNTVTSSEQIIAPVFGIAHTDDEMAYLAVVEKGQERANIEGSPNGVSVDYNRANAKFILRRLYTQPTSNNSTVGSLHTFESDRSHSDLQVRYIFLSGDKANYSGMATAYREYLIANGSLVPTNTDYKTRVDFLGTERENWVIGTSAVKMTSAEDVRDILTDLNGRGVNSILSVYKGWQDGGLLDLPIAKYKADSEIGGTKELTQLLIDAQLMGANIYLYNDALLINPDENNATFNVVKKVNKRRYEKKTYKDVYKEMLYLTPARSSELLDKFVSGYVSKAADRLVLAGISNSLFTYTYSGDKYTRFDTANAYSEIVGKANVSTDLILEQPFAYLWKDTQAFLDMPLYTSSYILEDGSIPFVSMVLKGIMPVYSEYVNFEANKQEFFLKLVETGTYPSFYITKESASELIYTNSSDIYSSEYSAYANTIAEYDKELKELNNKLQVATIAAHDILDNGVVRVTYTNGVKVYVNYGSKDAVVDGITIGAMSYEVVE